MTFISRQTIENRHSQIRSHLKADGQRALIVLSPDNLFYVSGFFVDVLPWERPIAAVIPVDEHPFLILNELSTHHVKMARARGSLAIESIDFYREHPSSTSRYYTRDQWVDLLAAHLTQRGLATGTIACDTDPTPLSGLANRLPRVNLIPRADLLRQMRLVKDSEELHQIREGGRLSDFGQSIYPDFVSPGKLMAAVDADVTSRMIAEGAKMFPGDRVEIGVYSLTGPASASPHGTGADSDTRIEYGDTIVNIIIVRLNGYVVENERTWIVGEANGTQEKAMRTADAATQAAIQQMVAGNPTSSIDAAAQGVIERAGFGDHIFHRTGHGIGINGHEYPDDVAFNHQPLQVGEVWSAEPGIYIYGLGGFRHDDTVIVGATQPEVVTQWSRSLNDLIIRV